MSLEQLINLAHRTGDRLIVHDPVKGRDVVILDVDEYERLIIGKKDVRSLSSGQLLDQINRDIAAWRANKELDEKWENEMLLEDEFDDEGPFDPFAEYDSHVPEWHSTGSVLEDLYRGQDWLENEENNLEFPEFLAEHEDKIEIEDIPDFEEVQTVPYTVPYKDSGEVNWKEEPLLSEEPVFYEEPIN